MRIRLPLFLCLAFQLGIPGIAHAVPRTTPSVIEESDAVQLKPGQFRWHPERATSGPVEIVVSTGEQQVYVYRSGTLIGRASVSTGTPDRYTPPGKFKVLQKKVFHRSRTYDNAPMPHMLRITWKGVALHAGHNPGYPASHGCIRLPAKFAQLLYGVTPLETSVVIIDDVPIDAEDALQLARNYGSQWQVPGQATETMTAEGEAEQVPETMAVEDELRPVAHTASFDPGQ